MVNQQQSNKVLTFILSSALILFYAADGINKYMYFRTASLDEGGDPVAESGSISIYFRLLYELIFIFIIYKLYDKERGKGLLLLGGLLMSFLIGEFTFMLNYPVLDYKLFYHITFFNKYTFVFIVYYAIKDIIDDQIALDRVIRVLEIIYLINSITILVGVFTQIELFRSYPLYERFGYDGMIASINEATLYYIIGISLLYFRYFTNKKGLAILLICIAASLMMGAKAIYLYLFLLLLYHLIFKANLFQKIFSVGALIVGIVAAIPVLLSEKYSFLFDMFIRQYENSGFLSMISSGRSDTIITKISDNLALWTLPNFLFGGTDQLKFYIEMDFFDAFLFFGFIGCFLYLILYFTTIFRGMNRYSFRLFFCVVYFIIAFMAGHFFASAVNALYINLVLLYIYGQERNGKSLIRIQGVEK